VRGRALLAIAAAFAASACTPPAGQLPDDPLDRATACTAVRALELSAGKAQGGPVSFEGFTEIMHFAMLAGAEDGVQVDLHRLFTVSQRAPAAMAELDADEWPQLVEPCNAAFPETQRPAEPLPPDPYEAGLTCFGLSEFFARTASDYPAERRELAELAGRALQAAQPTLRERAGNNAEAQRLAGGYTARGFKSGRAASLLAQCRRRFAAAPQG
jgi:hypothetical protein